MVAQAQLTVTVSPPKVTAQKAVVPLAMRNGLAEKIESARAVVFLHDEQGKMVGQGTRWVIGGSADKPCLAAGTTNAFHFVIASDKPFVSTNLTAKVSFSRVVLEGGKVADEPSKKRDCFRLCQWISSHLRDFASTSEISVLHDKGKTQQQVNCWVDSGQEVRAASGQQYLSNAEPFQIVCDYPHRATRASH